MKRLKNDFWFLLLMTVILSKKELSVVFMRRIPGHKFLP